MPRLKIFIILMAIALLLLLYGQTWGGPRQPESNDLVKRLVDAVQAGNQSAVQALLSRGANVNGRIEGATPLMYAATRGHTKIAQMLISRGAEVNAVSDGANALFMAACEGRLEMVKLLLSKGSKVNMVEAGGENTPLTCAAKKGHLEIVKLLVKHGAAINAKPPNGDSALTGASKNGRAAVVQFLRQSGAR